MSKVCPASPASEAVENTPPAKLWFKESVSAFLKNNNLPHNLFPALSFWFYIPIFIYHLPWFFLTNTWWIHHMEKKLLGVCFHSPPPSSPPSSSIVNRHCFIKIPHSDLVQIIRQTVGMYTHIHTYIKIYHIWSGQMININLINHNQVYFS